MKNECALPPLQGPPASTSGSLLLQTGLQLAADFVQQSLRPSSQRRYKIGFGRWERFCAATNLPVLPAQADHVAACLALVASETHSVSAVEGVYASISHQHRVHGFPSPTSNSIICLLMRSIRRRFGHPRVQVKPLTPAMIRDMIDYLHRPEHGIDALR